jgi:UDP-N-acetylglucosamine diphosphorylase / glucose-1-phosphate thymidylyltransferase / UDP-N-acetylgalactosamine diphosphorylase / glucosamine-1-phosphate N-acetyltransferase / galactosamine-1-phosphate N-acetyltransferase
MLFPPQSDTPRRVCCFEDRRAGDLEPLTLTRPAFDLLCGLTPLAAKQLRHFAAVDPGALLRPHLADVYRLDHPGLPVNDLTWLRAGPTVLVNGRWLPPDEPAPPLTEPCLGMIGDEVAFAVVGPEHLGGCSPNTLEDCLEGWKATLPRRPAAGRLVRYLWELVEHNGEQIRLDFRHLPPAPPLSAHPCVPAVVGPPELLSLRAGCRIDPLVVADTTNGPVVVGRDAVVGAFTRLEGPCWVGPGTHVLGAKVRAGTSLGPNCRVGGEVEASIVHGHSNKYHDGFLGHSYVGEWVNLGAGTSNSDLRNDYGEVTVIVNGRPVATGSSKVGCFLGDHTKTGLGTLLNTGTNAGVFCSLLPSGRLLPKYVPSFCSWWDGALADNANLPRLVQTAAKVMGRRGRTCSEAEAVLYRLLYDQTVPERWRAVREREQRQLRRSA